MKPILKFISNLFVLAVIALFISYLTGFFIFGFHYLLLDLNGFFFILISFLLGGWIGFSSGYKTAYAEMTQGYKDIKKEIDRQDMELRQSNEVGR